MTVLARSSRNLPDHIREIRVLVCIYSGDAGFETWWRYSEVSHGFPQFLQENEGIVLKSKPFPSVSSTIHYSVSFYHTMPSRARTDSAVKYSTKKLPAIGVM
jgi:hypothetical protein